MAINPIKFLYFKGNSPEIKKNKTQKTKNENQNPINEKGEFSKLLLGTVAAGFGFGARALFNLLDDDFVCTKFSDAGKKLADKNFKETSSFKKDVAALGSAVGYMGIFVAAIALIYTIFNTPKVKYETKVNTFTKSKDMDVYIKSKKIEKDLYDELDKKAKESSDSEKEKLKAQYFLLKKAKTEVPQFAMFN